LNIYTLFSLKPSAHTDNIVIRRKYNKNNYVWVIRILLISLTDPKGPNKKYQWFHIW